METHFIRLQCCEHHGVEEESVVRLPFEINANSNEILVDQLSKSAEASAACNLVAAQHEGATSIVVGIVHSSPMISDQEKSWRRLCV